MVESTRPERLDLLVEPDADVRETSLLEMPVSIPSAPTSSSTARLDIPRTYASMTTACSARSMRRPGSWGACRQQGAA